MASDMIRPDPRKVLAGLKDFQRKTVDYVFDRLYDPNEPAHRFLIADEVGLGKTLVARGLIAKAIDHLWDKVERIDIVYICSNEDIAKQNINRLNVTEQEEFSHTSRITLLPTIISNLKHNKLNFISFTPGTSFDLGTRFGQASERVLLYWMLDHTWGLKGAAPMNVFRGFMGADSFRQRIRSFQAEHKIDKSLLSEFSQALERWISADKLSGVPDMRSRFDDLCTLYPRSDARVGHEGDRLCKRFIGELRTLLAETCVRALQPDLIILDEFQRFKTLLEGKDQTGELARDLFGYADEETAAKILLLSATPYKMYTLSDEAETDDHYRDFVGTLRFLFDDEARTNEIESLIHEFRRELFRLADTGAQRAIDLKIEIETRLRRVMVRTERLSASDDRNGMLCEMPQDGMVVKAGDLSAYSALQKMARQLEQPNVIEYWKSAPYALNFMEDYEIKRVFNRQLETPDTMSVMAEILGASRGLILSWDDVIRYERIDPGNARLRALMADTVGAGAWKLLWVSPSMPYYELGGPYADVKLRSFTKRLVFSAWRVVPKMLATLLSYEASRQAARSFDAQAINTAEERERRQKLALLRFGRDPESRLTGMPVFALMYPSLSLSRGLDPLAHAVNHLKEPDQDTLPKLEDVIAKFIAHLEPRLGAVVLAHAKTETYDEAWYWAAPLLLDLAEYPKETREWIEQPALASQWTGVEGEEDDEEGSIWAEHVKLSQDLLMGRRALGRPPDDLATIVAELALGAPGNCALRAMSRSGGDPEAMSKKDVRLAAANVGWAFRNLFNHGEVATLVRGLGQKDPYWRRVLEYCAEGGLQSVLDEYAHALVESLGLIDHEDRGRLAKELGTAMVEALSVRPSILGVDRISVDQPQKSIDIGSERMSCRFAFQFSETKPEEGSEITRSEKIREAFNSPFWPFVLASTSVGQEGLDFHPYCHAIVHWNLPANPVDMEQREGRVHRYKGHAIRKNLAHAYGRKALLSADADPWNKVFELGKLNRPNGANDLVPYWLFPLEGGARIERHVPCYPLSRDLERLTVMRRSLAVYRMVFGQPRQEDLLAYLLNHFPEHEIHTWLEQLRIDLSPAVVGTLA